MNKPKTFAVVAFTFVLGYAERRLREAKKCHQGTIGPGGEFVPTMPDTQKDRVKRLEATIEMLHTFIDEWND